jgi:hypothetical protein
MPILVPCSRCWRHIILDASVCRFCRVCADATEGRTYTRWSTQALSRAALCALGAGAVIGCDSAQEARSEPSASASSPASGNAMAEAEVSNDGAQDNATMATVYGGPPISRLGVLRRPRPEGIRSHSALSLALALRGWPFVRPGKSAEQ